MPDRETETQYQTYKQDQDSSESQEKKKKDDCAQILKVFPKHQVTRWYIRHTMHSGVPKVSVPSSLVSLTQEPDKAKFTNQR